VARAARTTRVGPGRLGPLAPLPPIFIPRLRLSAALDEATCRPLTVVVAPAGWGKTSALAQWVGDDSRRVWWINPAAATAAETVGELLEALASSAEVGVLTSVPDVVIVDDAHRLPTEAWRLLDELLRAGLPERVRLVLASRHDVPLSLATFELTDAVTVLRAGSLRFTDAEARDLIALIAPHTTKENAAALQDRAQGWAAALVLGARTLGGAPSGGAGRGELAGSSPPFLDYLLGEVFATLPAATRRVLLCTADCDDVTEQAAVLLSGDPSASDRLADLAAGDLLVTAHREMDGVPVWRMHPLLREALLRLVASGGPDHAVAVAAHQRAALHYAAHGPVRDAIAHALAAGAQPLLASLLVDEGLALVAAGEEDLVVRALASLPPSQVTVQPALLGVSALAHRGLGDTETAARLASRSTRIASRVRAALADLPDGAPPSGEDLALLTDAALLEAWQARLGWTDVATAIAHTRGLLGCHHRDEMFTDRSSAPHTPHQPRWPLSSSRLPWLLNELAAAELWTGQLALAETHTGEALVAAEALGQHRVAAGTYANRALIEMIYGRLHDASTAARASLVAARRAGRTEDSLLARAHLVHAYIAFSHLHLEPAVEALERVRRISERATDPLVAALADHLDARLLAESGDLDAALALQSGPTVPDELPAYLVWLFALVRAQWAVRAGDRHEARRLAQLMLADGWPEGHGVLTAILTDRDGDPVAAAHQLDQLMAETPQHAAMLTSAIAAVYKVRMLLRDGSPRPLRPALHDMLARIGPHRLYSALIFTGPDPALDRRLR
jgi:LuxR family transcriptional regulator, maltose regulon positive regulatory protein